MIRQTFDELKASGQLPSPPGVGMRILKLTQDETHSAQELADLIMADSVLTGRLLELANSPKLGSAQPVTTVAEATTRLGLRAVKNVALGLSLLSSNRAGKCAKFDYDRYWSMSLARAVAAQNLSRCLKIGAPAEAYVLGLLCDIGRLALATVYPVEYAEILTATEDKSSSELARMERERFEIGHSEVGAYLLEEWGLPPAFSEAVGTYERRASAFETGEATKLARLLQHAQTVTEVCMSGETKSILAWQSLADALEKLRGNLDMSADDFTNLIATIGHEWGEWGTRLQLPTQEVVSPEKVRERARESSARLTSGTLVTSGTDAAALAPAATDIQAPPIVKGLRILAVDDDAMSLKMLARVLKSSGHQVQTASNGNEALEIALDMDPQVVIADWMMPGMDGLELCKALRRIECGRNMFFLLLTGRGEEDRIVEGFDAGVDDYVVKPFSPRVLMARIKGGQRVIELQEHVEYNRRVMMKQVAEMSLLTRKLRSAALTDFLTQMPNRRSAMKKIEADWEASVKSGKPLALIMIDIDHFKKINDTWGHDMGDVVLKETSSILRANARQNEEAARWGGEEFLVVCPGTTEAQAAVCAERLRAAVEANGVRNGTHQVQVTVSLGVAERTAATTSFDALIKAADDAVYAAKAGGRNCVHLAGSRWTSAKSA
jgi:two-component system cell cycle response regulator